MKNFVGKGETLKYKNAGSADITSGSPVVVGDILGVAAADITVGATGAVAIEGVYLLPKVAAAIAQGKTLYWDPDGNPVSGTAGSGCLTATTGTGQTIAGIAAKAAADTDALVACRLTIGA